jgi:hypothetical protein
LRARAHSFEPANHFLASDRPPAHAWYAKAAMN